MKELKIKKKEEIVDQDKLYAQQIRLINQEIVELEKEEELEEHARNKQLQK